MVYNYRVLFFRLSQRKVWLQFTMLPTLMLLVNIFLQPQTPISMLLQTKRMFVLLERGNKNYPCNFEETI